MAKNYLDKTGLIRVKDNIMSLLNGKSDKGTVLFSGNTIGGSNNNEDITLSSSVANYDYIEIYYYYNDTTNNKTHIGSTKLYNPNQKYVTLELNATNNTTDGKDTIYKQYIYINGTSISVEFESKFVTHFNLYPSGQVESEWRKKIFTKIWDFYIYRVVGYNN